MSLARTFLRARWLQSCATRQLATLPVRSERRQCVNFLRTHGARHFCASTSEAEAEGEDLMIPKHMPPPEGAPKEYSPKVQAIAEQIAELNIMEVSDLVDVLKDKLGLGDFQLTAGIGGGGGGAAAAEEEEEEEVVEQTEFAVKLTKFDPKSKIKLIKEVRAIGGFGLKEAKEIVESAPVVLKKDLSKEEATELQEKLKEFGAETELE